MKTCTKCLCEKPLTEFFKRGTRQYAQCKSCVQAYAKDYYRKNPDKRRAHKAKHTRRANLKKFGLTPDDYAQRLMDQRGCCAICKRPDPFSLLAVDHDHSTGKVRGLLCRNCNLVLGKMKDNPELLREAAAYLERAA